MLINSGFGDAWSRQSSRYPVTLSAAFKHR
jgi:hypothetical protein